MATSRTSWHAAAAIGFGLSAALIACSDSSSSGGAASTTTTAAATTQQASSTSAVTSLIAPGALVSGLETVTFRLSDAKSAGLRVAVLWSADQGKTWRPITSVGAIPQPASSAPAPGFEHRVSWNTAKDVPAFEGSVLLEVRTDTSSLRAGPFAVDNQGISTTASLSRLPYLQSTDQTSTYIRWRTLGARDGDVEFGETPGLGRTASGAAASEDHEVQLTGLQPGTRYYYRLVSQGKAITPRYSFKTAPDSTSGTFQFLVVGDSGMNNQAQLDIARQMASENADFFLHTGDVVYPAGGLGAAIREYNYRYFRPYQDFLHRTPGFPVVGNHDLYGLFGQPFREAFTLPSNGTGGRLEELYYSFEWGDSKFIAIESNSLFQLSSSGTHMTWLTRELSQNTKKWLVVYMHAPLWSAGKHGDNTALQNNLGPLIERYGVDLLLAGHEHNYERTKPIKAFSTDPSYSGLVHVITGGGGAALRPITPNAKTEVAVSAYHYMRFSVAGDTMTGEAVTETGAVLDRFQIRNR